MTEVEFDILRTQVTQLQKQSDDRAQVWRKLGRASTGLPFFFVVASAAFFVASLWLHSQLYPTAYQYAQVVSYQLLFTSLPLALLAHALRTN
jgi:hypothetical protein